MATPPSLSLTKPNNEEDSEKDRIGVMIWSLPKAKGWISHYLYQYQGFWHMFPTGIEAIISAQQNFKSKPGDVLVATHPKCGTTWLKSLIFAIKNRTIYQNSSSTAHPLLATNPHALVPNIESPFPQHYTLVKVENLPSPRLLGTHMPYNSLPESIVSSGCPVVYLCRDPKDLFVSMWHFFDMIVAKSSIIPLPEAFDLFCHGVSFMGPYWDHVLGYYKASLECPQRVLFLKYEDMQSDTLNHLKKLAQFLGCPFSLEEEAKGVIQEIIQLCSFQNMSKLKVTTEGKLFGKVKNDVFYRKGQVGDAKNYLTTEMMERLDQITKQKFQGFEIGY